MKWFDERGLLLTVDGAASPDAVDDATLAALRPTARGLGRRSRCWVNGRRTAPPLPATSRRCSRSRVRASGAADPSSRVRRRAALRPRRCAPTCGRPGPRTRAPLRRGLGDRVLVGRLYRPTGLRSSRSSARNFQRFVGIVDARLEALALLVVRDVQEELHDGRALVGEHAARTR